MNWHDFNNKRILGTVPVEADGSAYFAVPCGPVRLFPAARRGRHDGPVHAQRHHGAVRRTAGCVGCHEDRGRPRPPAFPGETGPAAATSLAEPDETVPSTSARPAQGTQLEGWHGAAARVQLPGRGAAGVRPALRALPRLRPGGRPDAEPGRRPRPGLQHLLQRTLAKEAHPGRRRRPARDPARLLLGLARQQAGGRSAPAALRVQAQPARNSTAS